jgi:hypothetical protein
MVGLLFASGCVHTRGRPFAIPVPSQLQGALAVDRDGNQILTGSFAGRLEIAGSTLQSAGGTDIYLAKINRAGAPVFPPQRFGGAGDDAATGVAVDDDGSIVLAGTIQGEAAFGAQRLRAAVRHARQNAVFVARLDPSGKLLWVKQIAVANLPTQVSVAVGPDHQIYVGATANGTLVTRQGQMASTGQSVALDVLSPKGESTLPAGGAQVRALMLPVGCAHSPCVTGDVLVPGCGPNACVAWICSVDSWCCDVGWDANCVDEVGSVCQRRCDCGTICQQGPPFYPDACNCVARVCSQDSFCADNYWDAGCIGLANTLCAAGCH